MGEQTYDEMPTSATVEYVPRTDARTPPLLRKEQRSKKLFRRPRYGWLMVFITRARSPSANAGDKPPPRRLFDRPPTLTKTQRSPPGIVPDFNLVGRFGHSQLFGRFTKITTSVDHDFTSRVHPSERPTRCSSPPQWLQNKTKNLRRVPHPSLLDPRIHRHREQTPTLSCRRELGDPAKLRPRHEKSISCIDTQYFATPKKSVRLSS